ncbi:MAG: glycerol-3-phosphate acyltransferase [Dehalococcoidia bacterium]|nr:glycerol-3-phosphate acyltransferase [Dehalococcoidia bacterium]MDH4299615.1 glycerol-3-phosphate acyltransferase [Dehalococcoidia bacterium]MDH4367995.1 glycerol-3-phosphate acyltransferase [Dehalococcoidia bacterium]
MISNIVIAIIIGYVFGSFPAAYLAGRLRKGIDIRDVGSRNMGAMNVFYQIGPAEATLVTLADLGKGIGAILLVRWLLGKDLISPFDFLTGLTATAAIMGHIFPVFLRFRGGKGAATAIGILIFLMPWAVPFLFVVFFIALLITRNPTFSYSLLLIVFPFVAGFIYVDHYEQPLSLVFYSTGLGIFLAIQYIPRLKQMHTKAGGDWRRVIRRRSLKERL